MSTRPPDRLAVDHPDGLVLRRARRSDADAVATAVRESLDHLARWMAWADERSCDPSFQRVRLAEAEQLWDERRAFEYLLVPLADEQALRASVGIMTRLGAGVLELGYWVHAAYEGRGYIRAAAAAATNAAFGVDGIGVVKICLDPANTRSAAIPQSLGFTDDGMVDDHPLGCGQCYSRTAPLTGGA
jgi:RimJ/RimL family protein N-acetyltransferase